MVGGVGGPSVPAFAVMLRTHSVWNGDNEPIKVQGIFDTRKQAKENIRHCLAREYDYESGYLDDYNSNDSEEEGATTARGLNGERWKLWIQKIDRTLPPVEPKSVYTIHRRDISKDRQSGMQDHDTGVVYETLQDANQNAREYFITEVLLETGPKEGEPYMHWEEWLDIYHVPNEVNRDSKDLPYTATDDAKQILVEVKALNFVPADPYRNRVASPSPSYGEGSDDDSSEYASSSDSAQKSAKKRRRAESEEGNGEDV
jgi:hypothetical protein